METGIYLIKSISILSIFYGVYFVFLRKDTLFIAKRHYLLAGILAALFLPFLEFTQTIYREAPTMDFEPLADFHPMTTQMSVPQETASTVDWWQIVLALYALGVVILLGRLLVQFISLLRLINQYPSEKRRKYTFVKVDKEIAPFSFFRYIVYNPMAHSEEELQMILKHEQVHASQWHSLDLIAGNLAGILQWMNPFSWLYKKSLEENLEFIADNETVLSVSSKKQYQLTLVKASSPIIAPALTTQFYQSFIKKRIIMLNKSTSKRRNIWKLSIVLPLLALFLWSFNVKEVVTYKENEAAIATLAVNETVSYFITPQTTDNELEEIAGKLESSTNDLKVRFEDRKRNAKDELTNLSIETKFAQQPRYYKNVVYGGDDEKTIAEIKVKVVNGELQFGSKDGQLLMRATPNGVVAESLAKQDPIEYPKKEILGDNPLYIINGEEYRKNELPKQEQEIATDGEIIVYNKEEGLEKFGEKGKDGVLYVSGNATLNPVNSSEVVTEKPEPNSWTEQKVQEFRIKINKNSTDAELNKMKEELLKEHGIDLSYSLRRNSQREITSIAISYTDDDGHSGSYNISGDEPIEEFFFYMDADGERGFWSEAHEKRMKERIAKREAQMRERRVEREARMKDRKERMEERRVEMEERNNNLARRSQERAEEREVEMEERRKEMIERREEMEERVTKQRKEMEEMQKNLATTRSRSLARSGSGNN
ncbi:MAG: M56 family metallopeptidase, partial [Bacteroidota bacterium]